MADLQLPTMHIQPGEHLLMVVVVATHGTQILPMPVLEQVEDQVGVVRQIAAALRTTAEHLEADADLVDDINSVGEAMDP